RAGRDVDAARGKDGAQCARGYAGDAEREDVRRAAEVGDELAELHATLGEMRGHAAREFEPARARGRERADRGRCGEAEAGGAGRILRAAAQTALLATTDP